MGQEYYNDVYVKCPFYDKGTSYYIQCEGIKGVSAVKLLFREDENGRPLKDERDNYSIRHCESDYTSCEIYKLLIRKYEVEEK